MATAEIRYDLIKSAFGLEKEELENILFELGWEPEKWEGEKLIVEVTPDRPDTFTTYGILRLLRNYLRKEKRKVEIREGNYEIVVDESVQNIRPFIAGIVCKGLNFSEEDILEIIQLQEKIHGTFGRKRRKASIGFYNLDQIKFPIIYTAKKPEEIRFIPLDFEEEMTGREILEKHPKGIEYGYIIKDFEKYPVLIDSEGKTLSMPPIINAEGIGRVTEKTKSVFVDVTGTHLETVEKIANIIAMTLSEMGGEVYSVKIKYPKEIRVTPRDDRKRMKMRIDKCRKLLGIDLGLEEIKDLLERMDYEVLEINNEFAEVIIPFYRVDILDEVDIIDDVGRAYGFNRMIPELPKVFTIGRKDKRTKVEEKISEILIGLGFNEIYTFSLIKKEEQIEKMRLKELPVVELGEVKVPCDSVRAWLLPSVLKYISINKAKEKPIKVFDISFVVIPDGRLENRARNEMHLSIAIYEKDADYTKIRQVVEYLMNCLGKKVMFKEYSHPSFIDGRCAQIIFHGEMVGLLGEIHPEVLENFKLEFPVAACEIDLERLFHFSD